MVALDDCGVRINPMIVEGQIHGGLTEGFAHVVDAVDHVRRDGNCIGSNFMDYLIPTVVGDAEVRAARDVMPSPHHPIGAKGVGESATVGSPAAYVNAVIDASRHLGVRNIDMPLTSRPGVGGDPGGLRREWTPRCSRWPSGWPRAGSLRAGDRGVAAGAVVGPAGSRGADHARRTITDGSAAPAPSRPWSARACARWTTASRGSCSSARPRNSRVTRADGIVTVPIACQSEGALEVYVEPVLPAPLVIVIGRSPVVDALAKMAAALGWRRRGRRRRWRGRRASGRGRP